MLVPGQDAKNIEPYSPASEKWTPAPLISHVAIYGKHSRGNVECLLSFASGLPGDKTAHYAVALFLALKKDLQVLAKVQNDLLLF